MRVKSGDPYGIRTRDLSRDRGECSSATLTGRAPTVFIPTCRGRGDVRDSGNEQVPDGAPRRKAGSRISRLLGAEAGVEPAVFSL